MTRTYDLKKIDELLERVRSQIGDERFAAMRLMELEKLVRSHDASGAFPGKTLLRERIHAFRSARWPQTAPKRLLGQSRW